MLAARRRLQHIACTPWIPGDGRSWRRLYSDKKRFVPFALGAPTKPKPAVVDTVSRHPQTTPFPPFGVPQTPSTIRNAKQEPSLQNTPSTIRTAKPEPSPQTAPSIKPNTEQQPSLAELLFPEEARKQDTQVTAPSRTVPRLPLDHVRPVHNPVEQSFEDAGKPRLENAVNLQRQRQQQHVTEREDLEVPKNVLVLYTASTGLVEEDFRRLVPQGKYIEGWALQASDIVKVIPGRDMMTLAQLNFYYILFSCTDSALAYKKHVTKLHKLVAENTPSSNESPIPPAPAQIIDGINVHEAMQSFSLVSPSQDLRLHYITPPMPPLVAALVDLQGYPALVNRSSRMPFEARLTFEGPQPPHGGLRHFLIKSGQQRSLSWSGGTETGIQVQRWDPSKVLSFVSGPKQEAKAARHQSKWKQSSEQEESRPAKVKHRTAADVYILGFLTESAAKSFVRYWHRRPLDLGAHGDDAPPIVNTELLW